MLRKLSFRTLAMLLAIVMMFSISVNATDAVPEGESVADVSAAEAVEALESLDALGENAGEVIDGETNGDAEIMANDSSLALKIYLYAYNQSQTVTYTPQSTVSMQQGSADSMQISPACIDYELQSGIVDINSPMVSPLAVNSSWTEADVSLFPYSKVAFMKVGYDADDNGLLTGNEQAPGSGYLIGPNVLLTAAHCVYDRDNQQFFDIEIYFGKTATSEGTRIHTLVAAVIDERYATETNGELYDWALISLGTDAAAGNYFGIGTVPSGNIEDHLEGETITVSGYFTHNNVRAQRYATGVVDDVTGFNRRFGYNIQTYPGMSGCPVFVNDPYMIAWGIHTKGPEDADISIRDGSGVQFTPIMYQYFCYHIDNGRALYGY